MAVSENFVQSSVTHVTQSEYDLLRTYIQKISGIVLDDSKKALLQSRLSPLLERYDCADYMALYQNAQKMDVIRHDICNAISIKETSFFRDPSIFDMIRDKFVLDCLNNSNSLHIWSAAAATGQEAYSIAMLLYESIKSIGKYDIRIEGTDISNQAIAYASYGLYTTFEVSRGVDAVRLYKHFEQTDEGFKIKDQLRYHAHFQQLNILNYLPFNAEFDIILCRNVGIYFDLETKRHMFEKLAKCLKPEGRLIIGSTETLWQVTDIYHRHEWKGVVYYSLREDES